MIKIFSMKRTIFLFFLFFVIQEKKQEIQSNAKRSAQAAKDNYSLVMDTYSFGYSSSGFTDMPMNHKVFLAQFDAIKKLASEGPCVMVGRCADYALSEYKDCFSVFVHADTDWRINRLSQKHNKTAKEAKDMINKTDKSRSSYYNYYTNKKWGAASSYNLCVDSSKLGIDGAAKAIIQAIEIFDSIKNK